MISRTYSDVVSLVNCGNVFSVLFFLSQRYFLICTVKFVHLTRTTNQRITYRDTVYFLQLYIFIVDITIISFVDGDFISSQWTYSIYSKID